MKKIQTIAFGNNRSLIYQLIGSIVSYINSKRYAVTKLIHTGPSAIHLFMS